MYEQEQHSHTDHLDGHVYSAKFDRPIDVLVDLSACNKHGKPEDFGATPLDSLLTMQQQISLRHHLEVLAGNPPVDVPLIIADYVQETFRDRFIARGYANDENYHTSLLKPADYADNKSVMALIDRAEQGLASPAELLVVRQLLGIRSVELACLTHPYGRRIDDYLETMRSTVRSGVLLMGGEYMPKEPRLRVKNVILANVPKAKMPEVYALSNRERIAIADQYGGVAGILKTRKTTLGSMPDGTLIKERSSFILRTDPESAITQAELDELLEYDQDNNWEDAAVRGSSLEQSALTLLNSDMFTQAIPISTTIYAYNKETARLVRQRNKGRAQIPGFDKSMALRQGGMEGDIRSRRVSMVGEMALISNGYYEEA